MTKSNDKKLPADEQETEAVAQAEQTKAEVEKEVEEEETTTTAEAAEAAEAEATEDTVPATEIIATLETALAEAQTEAGKNLEQWQRSVAELQNFKRRQEEQQKLQRDRIKAETLEGVISALDDLDLAFQNIPDELDGQLVGWVEGFRLVQRKLHKILDDQNVMFIDTAGEFNPNFHEAISYEDVADKSEGQIIAEVRKGYQIGNRVIRPALVRVAK